MVNVVLGTAPWAWVADGCEKGLGEDRDTGVLQVPKYSAKYYGFILGKRIMDSRENEKLATALWSWQFGAGLDKVWEIRFTVCDDNLRVYLDILNTSDVRFLPEIHISDCFPNSGAAAPPCRFTQWSYEEETTFPLNPVRLFRGLTPASN